MGLRSRFRSTFGLAPVSLAHYRASGVVPVPAQIDKLWAEEAERRVAQIDRGEVKLVPGEEVFAKIRRKYAR